MEEYNEKFLVLFEEGQELGALAGPAKAQTDEAL